jgi:hypothetical protein
VTWISPFTPFAVLIAISKDCDFVAIFKLLQGGTFNGTFFQYMAPFSGKGYQKFADFLVFGKTTPDMRNPESR